MSDKRIYDVTIDLGTTVSVADALDMTEIGGVLKIIGTDGDLAYFAPGSWQTAALRGAKITVNSEEVA